MIAAPLFAALRLLISLRLSVRHLKAVLICLCSVGYSFTAAANPVPLTLTEQAYIDAHPILSVCVDPDWLPFSGIDNNQKYIGILADLFGLVAENIGLELKIHLTQSWEESLAASKNEECIAVSGLNQTPEREQWLIFTDPLLEDPNVVITREDHPFIADLSKLKNKNIALQRGTAIAESLARDFPNLTTIYTHTESESMQLVAEGQADLTVRSLVVAAHTITTAGWYNLKVAGQLAGYENRSRIGIISAETTLRDALNQGIAAISEQERQRIMDRHLSLRVVSEVVTDYTLVYGLGILLLAVTATSLFWMRRLNALNAQLQVMAQTDALTQLTNRRGLNLTLNKDLARAKRHQYPLSVVMMDIDHFKRVNDNYGHLAGDKVLVDCAHLLKSNLRQSDIICRWGGEEFLVLCFDTDLEQATQVAEQLLEKVRHYDFPEVGHVTISAGVTQAIETDSPETFTKRADTLLYQAKNNGRDQVCAGGELIARAQLRQ